MYYNVSKMLHIEVVSGSLANYKFGVKLNSSYLCT